MKTPYFSIVTVCYNSKKTITDTIQSVLCQTFQDYEYIIIDGNSNDGTLDIIKKYKRAFKEKLIYISEKDNGLFDAMNKGVALASGKYVSILNSDDYYQEKTLELVYNITKDSKIPLIVIGDIMRVNEDKTPAFRYYFSQARIAQRKTFGHPSMFVPKEVYDKVGYYNNKYNMCADTDFHQRLYENYDEQHFKVVEEVFTFMRDGGTSDDIKKIGKAIRQQAELQRKYFNSKKYISYIRAASFQIKFQIRKLFPNKMQAFVYKVGYKLGIR